MRGRATTEVPTEEKCLTLDGLGQYSVWDLRENGIWTGTVVGRSGQSLCFQYPRLGSAICWFILPIK